jgi:hypothetical protein
MWCSVGFVKADVSEEDVTSIFKVEKFASKKLHSRAVRFSSLVSYSILNMVATSLSKTSDFTSPLHGDTLQKAPLFKY